RRPTLGAMACLTTIAAALGVADEAGLARRLFVIEGQDARSTLGGRPAAPVEEFAAHVAAALAESQIDPARTIAWGFPVVWGFAEMVRRLGFRAVVVDLVDDQRAWQMTGKLRAEMEAEYADSLKIADVVLTNCTGNQARFWPLRSDIQVIPNGAEIDWQAEKMPVPEVLAGIAPPIVGYVGNLRDRIDWEIIGQVARARPDWSVVLIGPQGDDAAAAPDPRCPSNLHLPGPVPYEVARACLRHFDVGIVPHLACEMTESMNPLKIYNYLAAGLPVVATAIPNLEGLADLITIASDAESFVAAIAGALSRPREDRTPADRVQEFAWPRRIDAMLRSVDARLSVPAVRPA
ncbi:MAG: glycosyltransferase, partial [Acetobacteraceae bacterium]